MSGAAAASTCGARGQQLDVTTGQMGPMMINTLQMRTDTGYKIDFMFGVLSLFHGFRMVVFTN